MQLNFKTSQKSFGLIISIFIIFVLSLAITYIVQIGLLANTAVIYAINNERAYYAALSGAEWGIYNAVKNSVCSNSTSFNLPTGGSGTESAISGYTVTITCNRISVSEGSSSYNIFEISSTSTRGALGSTDYSSRNVTVKATDL